jgi:hypothetical protein
MGKIRKVQGRRGMTAHMEEYVKMKCKVAHFTLYIFCAID